MPRSATEQDFQTLQGGKPTIVLRNSEHPNLVIHNYPGGENMIVPTHNLDMGTVTYQINHEYVEFPVSQVLALHGIPCETRSITIGGVGYRRKTL